MKQLIIFVVLVVFSFGCKPHARVLEQKRYENVVRVIVHHKNRISIFVFNENADKRLLQYEEFLIPAKYFDDVAEDEKMWAEKSREIWIFLSNFGNPCSLTRRYRWIKQYLFWC